MIKNNAKDAHTARASSESLRHHRANANDGLGVIFVSVFLERIFEKRDDDECSRAKKIIVLRRGV